MADWMRWLNQPGNSDFLGMMGAGLLGAAGPMPAGANRMALLAPAFGQAMQARNQGQQFALTKQLQELQMKAQRQQMQARDSRTDAISALYGGPDSKGIDFNAPRPMDAVQRQQMAARAAPEAALAQAFKTTPTGKIRDFPLPGNKIQKQELQPDGTWEDFGSPIDKFTQTPLVSQDMRVEREEQKQDAISNVAEWKKVRDDASGAYSVINQARMLQALPVNVGALEGMKAAAGGLAEALGVPLSPAQLAQVTDAQSFKAVSEAMVSSRLNQQTGTKTDDDARRVQGTLANLTNLQEANEFINNFIISDETRKVNKAKFYRQHKQDTGSYAGAFGKWQEFLQAHPIFGVHPTSGRPVFITQFMDKAAKKNPTATREDLLKVWRKQYGR